MELMLYLYGCSQVPLRPEMTRTHYVFQIMERVIMKSYLLVNLKPEQLQEC